MKQFSYKVMVRAHSEIFYDPGRVNRFFTKRKRKITTMKFSTIMVVDEVTPTDYIGEFEDKVRATFLPLTFLMLSTVVITGMTTSKLTQGGGISPFISTTYVIPGNTVATAPITATTSTITSTTTVTSTITTTTTTATTSTTSTAATYMTTITTTTTSTTTSTTMTTSMTTNASFYIKMEHSYPKTTASQAVIIINVPFSTSLYEKEKLTTKLDQEKINGSKITGPLMIMDQGDTSLPLFVTSTTISGNFFQVIQIPKLFVIYSIIVCFKDFANCNICFNCAVFI